MFTFLYRIVDMPSACRRGFVLLGAVVLLCCTQTSCERTSPTANQSAIVSESVIGKVINFTADSERYRVSGWNKSEGNFAWSEGNSARLAFPVPADAGALRVKMTLRGLIQTPALPSQPVEVYANKQKVADWEVADSAVFTAEISAEVTKGGGGTLNLELRIPKAASPKSLGMNTDERILGVCGYSIEINGAAVK